MFAARNTMFAGHVEPFDPATLSPSAWWDASDASTMYDATSGGSNVAVDGEIARWEDKSGNAYHMTQSSSSSRPHRRDNEFGSLDAVEFDWAGTFEYLNNSSSGIRTLLSNDGTLVVVGRCNGLPAGSTSEYVFQTLIGGQGNHQGILLRDYVTNPRILATVRNSSSGTSAYAVDDDTDQPFIAVSRYHESDVYCRIGYNGASDVTSSTLSGTLYYPGNCRIGAFGASGDWAWPLNGVIAEAFIFDYELSDVQKTQLENHLASKWGVTMS